MKKSQNDENLSQKNHWVLHTQFEQEILFMRRIFLIIFLNVQ
jgi:hypothetical protein